MRKTFGCLVMCEVKLNEFTSFAGSSARVFASALCRHLVERARSGCLHVASADLDFAFLPCASTFLVDFFSLGLLPFSCFLFALENSHFDVCVRYSMLRYIFSKLIHSNYVLSVVNMIPNFLSK